MSDNVGATRSSLRRGISSEKIEEEEEEDKYEHTSQKDEDREWKDLVDLYLGGKRWWSLSDNEHDLHVLSFFLEENPTICELRSTF